MTLLQFLDVNYRVLDVNPILKGGERKLTKNKEVPIICYEKDKSVYESDISGVITCSHYVEEIGKKSLSSEELKWIDYIHKEVIPSVSLYISSSVGNLK